MTIARKLFTPGPVPIEAHILAKGAEQLTFNRTQDFSRFTKEILQGLGLVFQTSGPIAILTGFSDKCTNLPIAHPPRVLAMCA